jgi:hypothetical protein
MLNRVIPKEEISKSQKIIDKDVFPLFKEIDPYKSEISEIFASQNQIILNLQRANLSHVSCVDCRLKN